MDINDDIMLTLATLPSDIIRMIVRMEEVESVDYMRLISRHWNSLVLELLNNKEKLPVIKNVHLFYEYSAPPYTIKKIYVCQCSDLCWAERRNHIELKRYHTLLDDTCKGAIMRKLKRASTIKRIIILTLPTIQQDALISLRQFIGDTPVIRVEMANLEIDNSSLDYFLAFLRFNSVQEFEADVRHIVAHTMQIFFNRAIPYLKSIKIREMQFAMSGNTATYFLGQPRQYWENLAESLRDSSSLMVDLAMARNNNGIISSGYICVQTAASQ